MGRVPGVCRCWGYGGCPGGVSPSSIMRPISCGGIVGDDSLQCKDGVELVLVPIWGGACQLVF